MTITKKLSSVIAGLILCALLLSSCALFDNKDTSPYIEGQRLTVAESEIEYSDSETTEIVMKLTNIASTLAYLRDGLVLSESEKRELVENIDRSVENVLEASAVDHKMATELLESIEKRLEEEESELTIRLFGDLYLISLGKLGRERAADLVFYSTLAYLDNSAKTFRERYEKYGYSWYLEDAEHYDRLSLEIKENIGEEKLADALGVVFFSSSLVSGTPLLREDEGFSLDSGELLLLLKKQAEHLDESALSRSQWQTVFELLFEVCFSESQAPKHLDEVEKEEYSALRNCDDYALKLGNVMPYLTDLYAAAVNKLSEERLVRLMSEDASVAKLEFLNSVYMCKNEFFALTASFSKQSFTSEHEKNALERAGAYEDYLKYAEYRRHTDGTDLYNAIGAYLSGRQSEEQLHNAFEGYLFSSAPYFTYVFIFDNRG